MRCPISWEVLSSVAVAHNTSNVMAYLVTAGAIPQATNSTTLPSVAKATGSKINSNVVAPLAEGVCIN